MVRQNLKKPNFQQTRLVVRVSNKRVICQMVKAYPKGDITLAYADSSELRAYNIKFGLKNFSACYLTGLLLGSRVMRQSKLKSIYKGNKEKIGVSFLEANIAGQPATYRAILDIGLKRPTLGSKVFAALKGVCDAGVYVPHKSKLFFGYDKKEKKLNSEKLRSKILGEDLAKYAVKTRENNENTSLFSQYPQKETIYPALIQQAINIIHKNPKKIPGSNKMGKISKRTGAKVAKMKKKSYEQRRADIEIQKQAWLEEMVK